MSLARRLDQVEAALTPAAPEPDAWEARQARYWAAWEILLNQGMPRPYAEQVYAEMRSGTPQREWSALTNRVHDLASYASWAPEAVNPYRGPLVIPQRHCEILTAHGDDVESYSRLACQACHLEALVHPYGRHPRPEDHWPTRGSVSEPWDWQDGLVCAHCGGELRWPASAVNVWWRSADGSAWRWDPHSGTITRTEPEKW